MKGFPVVIATNGLGIPVRPVEANAPSMTVAANGLGIPIVISENGAPSIVDGYDPTPPVDFDWQPFDLTAGTDGAQWIGYSDGSATLPQPVFGAVSSQPSALTDLLGLYDDTNSNVYLAVFSGEWLAELSALPMSIGGTPFTPFDASIISGNTWVRYTGLGDWQDGAMYQVEFG